MLVSLSVSNEYDAQSANEGRLAEADVRRVEVARVLVDSGATFLSLPEDLIQLLGLPLRREVPIATAAGRVIRNQYKGATIVVEGREGTFDCIGLPPGTTPLLGVEPLESLGIELDLQRKRLVLLPMDERATYINAFGAE